jgi:hypothetical protein
MQHPRMISLLRPAPRMRAFMILVILAGALAPLCVRAQSSISIAGRWTGTMDVTSEFGELKHYEEMMTLDQSGQTVSGSFGLSAAYLTPVLHGRVHGAVLTFEIAVRGHLEMYFHLHLTGNQLVGYAMCTTDRGLVRAKVTLVRVTEEFPQNTPRR